MMKTVDMDALITENRGMPTKELRELLIARTACTKCQANSRIRSARRRSKHDVRRVS